MDYTPDITLTHVKLKVGAKNDAHLARILEVEPPMISKIRNQKTKKIGAYMLLRMHFASNLDIRVLKELAGMRCLPKLVA